MIKKYIEPYLNFIENNFWLALIFSIAGLILGSCMGQVIFMVLMYAIQ